MDEGLEFETRGPCHLSSQDNLSSARRQKILLYFEVRSMNSFLPCQTSQSP